MPFLKELIADPGWLDDYPFAREAWDVFKKRIFLDSNMLLDIGMALEADFHGDLFVGFNLRFGGPSDAYLRITAPTDEKFSFDSSNMPSSEITFSTLVEDSELANRTFTLIW